MVGFQKGCCRCMYLTNPLRVSSLGFSMNLTRCSQGVKCFVLNECHLNALDMVKIQLSCESVHGDIQKVQATPFLTRKNLAITTVLVFVEDTREPGIQKPLVKRVSAHAEKQRTLKVQHTIAWAAQHPGTRPTIKSCQCPRTQESLGFKAFLEDVLWDSVTYTANAKQDCHGYTCRQK